MRLQAVFSIAVGVVATATMLGSVAGNALPVPAVSLAVASSEAVMTVQDRYDQRVYHHRHGYRVNRYGYGNYVRGPHGSFGGYPAGSAAAQELRTNQRTKCEAVPEQC